MGYAMKRVLSGLVVLVCSVLLTPVTHAKPYDTWIYRSKITFAGYDKSETLTNFPVLLRWSPSAVSGFQYSHMASPADGADWTDAGG